MADEILNLPKYHLLREAVQDARARQQGVYFNVDVYILFPNAGGWVLTHERPPVDMLYFVAPKQTDQDQRVRANLFADYTPPSRWIGDAK